MSRVIASMDAHIKKKDSSVSGIDKTVRNKRRWAWLCGAGWDQPSPQFVVQITKQPSVVLHGNLFQ